MPATLTLHHADLHAIHKLLKADATLGDAIVVTPSGSMERLLLQATHGGGGGRRDRAEAAIVIGQNKASSVLLGGPKHQER
jgi:hypothetical protein